MRRSQGMSFIGMLLVTGSVVLIALLAIRIFPVYLENYNILQSMKTLNALNTGYGLSMSSHHAILLKKKLLQQLNINGIDIPEDQIQIKPTEGTRFNVNIHYQVTKPLVGNISLLFDFNPSYEVSFGGQ